MMSLHWQGTIHCDINRQKHRQATITVLHLPSPNDQPYEYTASSTSQFIRRPLYELFENSNCFTTYLV
jgi:hypothetical protein